MTGKAVLFANGFNYGHGSQHAASCREGHWDFTARAIRAWLCNMKMFAAKRFAPVLAIATALVASLAGCGIQWHSPPPSPLQASWNRYQLCIHQAKNVTQQCERLKLAYETQLNRAPR